MTPEEIARAVRSHLDSEFAARGVAGPDVASVTFLGSDAYDLLRYGPDANGVSHFVSVGAARYPMNRAENSGAPAVTISDDMHGPRAELVISLRGTVFPGLARSLAVLAVSPAVEGLVLENDSLVDLSQPLWQTSAEPASAQRAFTAVLLQPSAIADLDLIEPLSPVQFTAAVPITANEAAWVRLKGAQALRDAWRQAEIDVLDPSRAHGQPS